MRHYVEGLTSLREESGDLDSYFLQNFWNVSNAAERTVLKCGASDDGADDEAFKASGDENSRADAIIEARRRFLVTGILERVDDGRYRVAGTVFRQWLDDRADT
jgi:hypothetical protein